MNPLLQKMVGSGIRFALAAGVGWLVTRGIVKAGAISPDQIEVLTGALVTIVVGAWAFFKNKTEIQMQQTALAATKPGATLEDVKEAVKAGVSAPASTPVDMPPVLDVPPTQAAEDAKRRIVAAPFSREIH